MDVKTAMKRAVLFHGMNEKQLDQLATISHEHVYNTHEKIFEEGALGDGIYIIGTGQVSVEHTDSDGNSTAAIYLGEGQVFGEMSLIDGAKRSASIVAVDEHTQIYHMSTDDLNNLCQTNTDIGYVMMRNIAQDLSFKLRHGTHNPQKNA